MPPGTAGPAIRDRAHWDHRKEERLTMRNAFAGILAGIVALFAFSGTAEAAPALKRPAVQSVCETGFRGQPEYDRKCLKTGTFKSGAMLWLDNAATDRKAACKSAVKAGIRMAVRELVFDVAYDTYRNHNTVITYATAVATAECKALGYKIKK